MGSSHDADRVPFDGYERITRSGYGPPGGPPPKWRSSPRSTDRLSEVYYSHCVGCIRHLSRLRTGRRDMRIRTLSHRGRIESRIVLSIVLAVSADLACVMVGILVTADVHGDGVFAWSPSVACLRWRKLSTLLRSRSQSEQPGLAPSGVTCCSARGLDRFEDGPQLGIVRMLPYSH